LFFQVLRGLNKKYDHIKTYLKWVRLFPSFHDICNDLFLEELTLEAEASLGSATTLAVSGEQQRPPSSIHPYPAVSTPVLPRSLRWSSTFDSPRHWRRWLW
jgi:hypothetical protein